jgi:hypothetical protein
MKFPGVCSENTPFETKPAVYSCDSGYHESNQLCVPNGYSYFLPGLAISDQNIYFALAMGVGFNFPNITLNNSSINFNNSIKCVSGSGFKGKFSLNLKTDVLFEGAGFNVFFTAGQVVENSNIFSATPYKTYNIPSFTLPINLTIKFDWDLASVMTLLTQQDLQKSLSQ